MSNWSRYKADWEQALDDAEVYDRGARRVILAFMRKVNTLQNMLDRMSWRSVQNSGTLDKAYDLANDVEPYMAEYNAMLKAAGLNSQGDYPNINDLIA